MRNTNDILKFVEQLRANIDFLESTQYYSPKAIQIEVGYDKDLIEDLSLLLDEEQPIRDDVRSWYVGEDKYFLEIYRESIGLIDV